MMKKYLLDDNNTVIEETDQIKIHNYPPHPRGTLSYLTKTCIKREKGKPGLVEVDLFTTYFDDLSTADRIIAENTAVGLNYLSSVLKRGVFLDGRELRDE